MSSLLKASDITMQFGGLKAVDQFNLDIEEGDLFGLIGPNGAGKTTVFNVLTGVYKPTSGQVVFNGKVISQLRPFEISRLGVTRTFQNIRLFRDLTVLENVLIAGDQHVNYGLAAPLLETEKFLQAEAAQKKAALELLSIFGLESKAQEISSSLPYGQQRKLEIIRALATRPKLICLDEPAAGMNHQETHELMQTIAQIRKDFKLTVLLIEHDMKLVMGICEKIAVLDHGVKIEEGSPSHIQKSPKVIEAYLGSEAEH